MSSDEFIASCRVYRRYLVFMSMLSAVSYAAAVLLALWLENRGGCDSGACLLGTLFAAVLIGWALFYATIRGSQKRAKELGLFCPSCRKLLVGSGAMPGVVTGHCSGCRAKVLDTA